MMNVQKRDGSMEPFNRNKVAMAVTSAGGSAQDAEKVAAMVEAWMPMAGTSGAVSSSQIRMKVIGMLKQLNPTAGAVYAAYKK